MSPEVVIILAIIGLLGSTAAGAAINAYSQGKKDEKQESASVAVARIEADTAEGARVIMAWQEFGEALKAQNEGLVARMDELSAEHTKCLQDNLELRRGLMELEREVRAKSIRAADGSSDVPPSTHAG